MRDLKISLGCTASMGSLGFQDGQPGSSQALYSNPEQADLVFTKGSMGQQYLEQLDSHGGLADAAGG